MSSNHTPPNCRGFYWDWRSAEYRYYTHKFALKNRFGTRVQRISLDAGFTCPNVDGRVATGGCAFCNNRSFSPSRRLPGGDIHQQLEAGIDRLRHRYRDCDHFTAYFQPATNTYAPVDRLRAVYEEALTHPQVVALAIGTRPDCVPDAVLDLLSEIAQHTFVSVEFGMQTMHDRTLDWMNRGHHHDATIDAIARSRARGFEIGVHIVLGLPGESRDDMLATAREVARLDVDAVKLHNLHAVENTPLADQVRRGEVQLMPRDQYVQTIADILELLPPRIIIQRISGDAPSQFLVGPSWCSDKAAVRRALDAELQRRDSWQGKRAGQGGGARVTN